MTLKKLKIKREDIGATIQSIDSDYEVEVVSVHSGFERVISKKDGKEQSKLNVYYVKDGTTTIAWHECGNKEVSEMLANEIAERCKFGIDLGVPIYIKKMEEGDFNELLTFLSDFCEAKISGPKNLSNGIQYTIESVYGDKAYINYFNNKSFNVQGINGLIKSQIIEGLSSYLTFNEIVEATLEKANIDDLDKPTVVKLYEARFPYANQYLNETVKSIIVPTFILQRLCIDASGIEDFSFMVFPILRGIEGCIKSIFSDHGIDIDNHIGNQFYSPLGNGIFLLQKKHTSALTSLEAEILEKLYNYHKNNRHSIFHVDDTILTTRLIESQEIANSIINEACELIEKCYTARKENDNKYLV